MIGDAEVSSLLCSISINVKKDLIFWEVLTVCRIIRE